MADVSGGDLTADYTDDVGTTVDGFNTGLDAQNEFMNVATEGKWAQNAMTTISNFIKGMQPPL